MPMPSLDKVLATYFAESATICGTEKTYHALFCHHMLKHGASVATLAREVVLSGRKRTDVVVFDPAAKGNFSRKELAKVAIEFKGGAYGNRNALRDTIRNHSKIADLEKLSALPDTLEKWFLCLDLPELGRALQDDDVRTVAHAASQYGINFAYYCGGEDTALIARSGRPAACVKVTIPNAGDSKASGGVGRLLGEGGSVNRWLRGSMAGINGSEDVLVSMIYHGLRNAGYAAGQLSLETYYSFAGARGQMQYRPDMSVFSPGVMGRFNLYRDGNRNRSNDANKLYHLKSLIEVKGSAATTRATDKATEKLFVQDIEKLVMWQERAQAMGDELGVEVNFESIFVGADLRQDKLNGSILNSLEATAIEKGVHFIYLPLSLGR